MEVDGRPAKEVESKPPVEEMDEGKSVMLYDCDRTDAVPVVTLVEEPDVASVDWGGAVDREVEVAAVGIDKPEGGSIDGEDAERELHEASLAAGSLGEREADGELDARTYTRTFMGCADYCGMFDVSNCVGVSFNAGFEGNCQALASIDGSFVVPGEIAAVRM